MKISIFTEVDVEQFTLVTTTTASFMGRSYEHEETTDLTDMYNLFIGQMIEDGWLEDEA